MKPEQIYREKINKVLIKYFDLDEEVKSINGKRIDYILKCKKTNAIFGLEVKSEMHKRGIDVANYLDQAKCYASEFWKTKFTDKPINVLIFITPAISSLFMQVDKSYKPIIHKGHEYYKSFHPKLFKHSNINSWISKSYNIGEVRIHREYGNSFAFIFMNKIIWETSDFGTIFNIDTNNFYLKP
jgi:hypothetical protein